MSTKLKFLNIFCFCFLFFFYMILKIFMYMLFICGGVSFSFSAIASILRMDPER
jgi:ABC-type multidrug transport system permease subunit